MFGGGSTTWEQNLIGLARKALESHTPAEPVCADRSALDQAYRYCETITERHSRTFSMASALLPFEKRRAARALYAFCRISDDLVDRPDALTQWRLENWRQRAKSQHPREDDPIALAWADTRARFQIPYLYAEQLLDGVSRDLHQKRYQNFGDLTAYCYGVASTVGLMAMHIIGFQGPEAVPYAIKLGIALQLTNILRDVGEDWQNGRLYLPLDELEMFGIKEKDLSAGKNDDRWQAFLRFQIERTRRLYAEAIPGIQMLSSDGRFAIAAAADLYSAVINDIEAHNYDVFQRRAHISTWGKLRRLPAIWLSLWF